MHDLPTEGEGEKMNEINGPQMFHHLFLLRIVSRSRSQVKLHLGAVKSPCLLIWLLKGSHHSGFPLFHSCHLILLMNFFHELVND